MKQLNDDGKARYILEEITTQGAFCVQGVYTFQEAKTKLTENASLRIYGAGMRKMFNSIRECKI